MAWRTGRPKTAGRESYKPKTQLHQRLVSTVLNRVKPLGDRPVWTKQTSNVDGKARPGRKATSKVRRN